MNIETTTAGVPAISSLEIAKITGKNHQHVLRDIRQILSEAEIDVSRFGHISKDSYGRDQKCFLLPKRECMLVVSGYSVRYRLAIIDRLEELEANAAETPRLSRIDRAREEYEAALQDKGALLEHEAIKPLVQYGSAAANGKLRLGMRRASYVASASRIADANELWSQRLALQAALDEVNGQLRFTL